MEIKTERKDNDWEHTFYVDDIEVIMKSTDGGGLGAEWEEDGWEISANHWYGDGDRLPHKVVFSVEKEFETRCKHCNGVNEEWVVAEMEVELWGAWESDESACRVYFNDIHTQYSDATIDTGIITAKDDYEHKIPTDTAVAIAADIREACYRIYSEKRECVKA